MVEIKRAPKRKEGADFPYVLKKDYLGVLGDFLYEIGEYDRNLDYFFANACNIEFIETKKIQDNRIAEYNPLFNTMHFNKDKFDLAIMHELLHMASSHITRNRIYSGFRQIDKYLGSIGVGLTEGYTVLLDERYFKNYHPDKVNKVLDTYPCCKYIAELVELAVGMEDMENKYFTADLKGLYDYLSSIMGEDKTYNFLLNTDKVFELCDDAAFRKVKEGRRYYHKCMLYIGELLLKLNEYNKFTGNINEQAYENNLELIKKVLTSDLYLGKYRKKYPHYSEDDKDIQKVLNRSIRHYITLN